MHPDALIAALQAELDELRNAAEPDVEREKAIQAQIDEVDERPRPVALPENPETVYDRSRVYQEALEVELHDAEHGNEPPVRGVTGKDRAKEIRAELERVKAERGTAAEEEHDELSKLKREDLNEIAVGLGVEDPDKLGNKEAVVDAITAAREAA